MIINGKWYDNITCKSCKARHPAHISCDEAKQIAEQQKVARDKLNIEISNKNQAFDEWFDKQINTGYAFTSDEQITRWAWKAAKADSAQEIERLKAQAALDESLIAESTRTIQELQAHIEELRHALQLLRDSQNGCPLPKYENDWNEAMRLADEALASTPQQSLQNVIDETIERCAKVCDTYSLRNDDMGAIIGRAIRALKGKHNG
jgi:hypothetical protein